MKNKHKTIEVLTKSKLSSFESLIRVKSYEKDFLFINYELYRHCKLKECIRKKSKVH